MARIVKEVEFAARRNEILDAAQRLIFIKGFEQTSITDILEEAKISKGAFYHYFDSKSALLEALIERMLDDAVQILTPILNDPTLPAIDKISLYFNTAGKWKADRKDFLLSFLNVWYADNNAILRQKMFAKTVKRVAPMLAEIVREGVQEGTLTSQYPDEAATVIIHLLQGVGDLFIEELILGEPATSAEEYQANLSKYEQVVGAYTDAMERVLGAPGGSLVLMDRQTITEWAEAARSRRSVKHEIIFSAGVA